MEKRTILITNLTLKNDGFAVTAQGAESVYIPPGVTLAAKLVPGEYREAHLVPNSPDKQDRVPWMAAFVDPLEGEPINADAQRTKVQKPMDQGPRIMDIADRESYFTTDDICRELDINAGEATLALEKLFTAGDLVKAVVFTAQGVPEGLVLWAMTASDFE